MAFKVQNRDARRRVARKETRSKCPPLLRMTAGLSALYAEVDESRKEERSKPRALFVPPPDVVGRERAFFTDSSGKCIFKGFCTSA